MNTKPTVSIAIPTLDEAANIREVLERFLATRYPNLIEILVADGGSSDGTREIVNEIAARDARVALVDNPGRYQAAGLNLLLARALGEVFLRADGHCLYANDYVETCVETLVETGAQNVGGAQRFVAQSAFQAGIALASRSLLGSGGALYRDPERDGWADTVFLGCFWRDTLRELRGYVPRATPNEDAELNLRLIAKARAGAPAGARGGVYVSSRIRVEYLPRPTLVALFRQYFRYGQGRCRTVLAHPIRSPWRGRMPFLLVSGALALALLDAAALGGRLHTVTVLSIACLAVLAEGVRTALRYRERFREEFWRGDPARVPSLATRAFACGVVLVCQPIAHSLGFARELVRQALYGRGEG